MEIKTWLHVLQTVMAEICEKFEDRTEKSLLV